MVQLHYLFVLQTIALAQSFLNPYPKLKLKHHVQGVAGLPLFLTPYVENGNIGEGRRLARVPFTEDLKVKSFAGFFTVNKTYNSNQFFWYFPAIEPKDDLAPVVVWLQGGPGGSSLYGLFEENGPIFYDDNKLQYRKYNWALSHHLIYIDNPVGTGFSFTNDSRGYCTDEVQVGEQLYSTMIQFFQLFPHLQKNKFYITGESYAGKYVPALAYTIHMRNPTAQLKINLKGVAIGNGWTDPEHQLGYGEYLYQIGLIDWNDAKAFKEYDQKAAMYLKNNEYEQAASIIGQIYKDITKSIGNISVANFLFQSTSIDGRYRDFINNINIRQGIHVSDLPYDHLNEDVKRYLNEDLYKSVAPWVSELLDHYDVVLYNGQLDIGCAYSLTVNYLRNLNFTGSEEYNTAKRNFWTVDGELAGYMKCAGKLVEVMVRNAGHMVPADQPKWALDLITKITHQNISECSQSTRNR